jgi:drug/metabolite transporter (DMT)-like permease
VKGTNFFTNRFVITISALLCCALWGSATPFIKIGYKLSIPHGGVPSTILFAGIRFMLAGILTIIIYSIARKKILIPQKDTWPKIFAVSSFQTVIQYILFYIGLANTTGIKGTVASGSGAFFSLIIASLFFKQEKLTAKKMLACIIGFAGVILINLDGLDFNMNFFGDAFVIFSAISYSVSSVLVKKYSSSVDPVIISGYQFIIGGIFMIIIGLIFGGQIYISTVASAAVLIYLAFLSAIAYALWGVLLMYNQVSKITIFTFMTPVFGVILSSLMLTESGNVSALNIVITLVLICTGIIMLNYKKQN